MSMCSSYPIENRLSSQWGERSVWYMVKVVESGGARIGGEHVLLDLGSYFAAHAASFTWAYT